MQFKAIAKAVEVNGQTVLSIVDGSAQFKKTAYEILARHGIVDPKEGHWYSQQGWLDAFKEIAEHIGPNTLFQIGTKIPDNAVFPPQINSVPIALAAIDIAYHINHRGGPIGNYGFEKTGEREAVMVCANPYPCEFDRGIISAMARRFQEKGKIAQVTHDDSKPCRKHGAESCTYKVTW